MAVWYIRNCCQLRSAFIPVILSLQDCSQHLLPSISPHKIETYSCHTERPQLAPCGCFSKHSVLFLLYTVFPHASNWEASKLFSILAQLAVNLSSNIWVNFSVLKIVLILQSWRNVKSYQFGQYIVRKLRPTTMAIPTQKCTKDF